MAHLPKSTNKTKMKNEEAEEYYVDFNPLESLPDVINYDCGFLLMFGRSSSNYNTKPVSNLNMGMDISINASKKIT